MTSVESELREREKELDCLYHLSPLFTSYSGAEEPLLKRVTLELSKAMTNPKALDMKLKIVREGEQIVGQGNIFTTSRLNKDEKLVLYISFFNNEDILVPREKNLLISAVELSAIAVQRLRNEAAIKGKNATLTELLTRLQNEREKDAETIQVKIQTFLFPLLNQLRQILPDQNQILLSLIQTELENLTNKGSKLNSLLGILTPREMEVCSFVAKGVGSKEIANCLNISPETVERHRCTIRKKLKLNGKAINLQTYLINL
ncbi:LuxR family transcriptional regulator [Thiospirochaeta perfilievii]|uniref:LuxR family transcriptional regulator n=1 Tax=Thiospirochaeta perfilievii TaxID=252967 RepID=A0A5C1QDU2_9SPIO|nr:LuxR C-terminal-related transcriptional regulator [Thiospirochaeta perfilievii]QEN05240.1 LuxR family transcriptional regulator [Thiospirochaeta perfilievii]